MGLLGRLGWVGLRAGLVGGAIAGTAAAGVWSTSPAEGARVLEETQTELLPGTRHLARQMPQSETATERLEEGWNQGVADLTKFIQDAPTSASQGAQYLIHRFLY